MAKYGLFDTNKLDAIREFDGARLSYNVNTAEQVLVKDSNDNITAVIRLAPGQCVKQLSEDESKRAPR